MFFICFYMFFLYIFYMFFYISLYVLLYVFFRHKEKKHIKNLNLKVLSNLIFLFKSSDLAYKS